MRYLFITFSLFSDILFYIAKGELKMFKQRQTDMLNGIIWKEILLFFVPIMFGSIFQQLYNTADAMVVGNYVGKEALAAVGGSTGVVIGLLVNLIVGLSSGATVVIAQAYGSNDYSSVKKAVQTAMSSSVFIGAIFTVIGIVFTPLGDEYIECTIGYHGLFCTVYAYLYVGYDSDNDL